MIIKYSKYIKESRVVDSYFFQTYEETKAWLDSMHIENYTINDDLTVDVNNKVDISYRNLTKISVQFGYIKNYFACSYNNLTSLKGSPKIVEGDFYCHCNQLTSLKECSKIINGNLFCDEV